jgi:hypothetical protein
MAKGDFFTGEGVEDETWFMAESIVFGACFRETAPATGLGQPDLFCMDFCLTIIASNSITKNVHPGPVKSPLKPAIVMPEMRGNSL